MKSERTRQRLFEAAIALVGSQGHAGATIRNITTRARIAQGTFYNYFETQQDIFDQIVPYLGNRLLAYVEERLEPGMTIASRSDVFLVAFDDFVHETPAFYRVVAEAAVFAPKAYRLYVATTLEWLGKHLEGDPDLASRGTVERRRLEVIALIVLGGANHINMRFGDWMGEDARTPRWAVDTFHQFVQAGLAGLEHQKPLPASKAAKTPAAVAAQRLTPSKYLSGNVVKFTPYLSPMDGRLNYSAQSVQIDCRKTSVSQGHVVIELDIDPRSLNSRGAVAGGTISALVEVAAAAAMSDPAEQVSAETINLNCIMVRPAMEGTLVADTRVENAGRHVRFVTVRITLDTLEGPLVASATATMRVIE